MQFTGGGNMGFLVLIFSLIEVGYKFALEKGDTFDISV